MDLSLSTSNFVIGVSVLNQWSLDFSGNLFRCIKSLKEAKNAGVRYRLGPELELTSYGCEDHFHELDTFTHAWQCLAQLLEQSKEGNYCSDMVCDVGMPIQYAGIAYNCRVIFLNGRILLIRPKLVLSDDGLHRESRWFTAWPSVRHTLSYHLPDVISRVSGQQVAPFGDALLRFALSGSETVTIGLETCEELWIGRPPHVAMYSSGADAVLNASASHHELRKLHKRIELITNASRAGGGGLYAYANLRGCDSERACFDGGGMVAFRGKLICCLQQFGLAETELARVVVDVRTIRANRTVSRSFGREATVELATEKGYPIIEVPFALCTLHITRSDEYPLYSFGDPTLALTSHPPLSPLPDVPKPIQVQNVSNLDTDGSSAAIPRLHQFIHSKNFFFSAEEEIALGPSLWLWDMLRRSKSGGFFLCLSGGLDSSSVACIVYSMCIQVADAIRAGKQNVLHDCELVTGLSWDKAAILSDQFPTYPGTLLNSGDTSSTHSEKKCPSSALFHPFTDPRALTRLLLTTCFMGSEQNSLKTQVRASNLSKALGSRHIEIRVDKAVGALVETSVNGLLAAESSSLNFSSSLQPRFKAHGGSVDESLALQNVQARTRMVLSYLIAQLTPWCEQLPDDLLSSRLRLGPRKRGNLLMLSSANLDETLLGYLTKYDCSSADLNPIGSISKLDLRRFMQFVLEGGLSCSRKSTFGQHGPCAKNIELDRLLEETSEQILNALPSAELEPLSLDGSVVQTDELDMGLTYDELSIFGRLRKQAACGPYSMLAHLLFDETHPRFSTASSDSNACSSPAKCLADKVKHFFRRYAISRHKSTVLPPSYHTEAYSADDNRHDLRPCLYPADWTLQFSCMDTLVAEWENKHGFSCP